MAVDHVAVCVCTFRRPTMLARLLCCLDRQCTDGRFTWSVVVVDNDAAQSGRATVEAFRSRSQIRLSYAVVREQNIALARNAAVEGAKGTYLAFIDDDEFPPENWLLRLVETCEEYRADGVLGPVLPHFEKPPPNWVLESRLFERPLHRTGDQLDWRHTRTGNVLFRRAVFAASGGRFDPRFGSGGEDRDFFRRMIRDGYRFVWCAEASVWETVPAFRWKCSVLFRRALLRGQVPSHSGRSQLTAAARAGAAALYCAFAVAPALLLGRHVAMNYLVRTGDHLGRVLVAAGFKPIREAYITE